MYFKGALFLNTLRSVVNDDARWLKLLHDLFQHFKYQNIMTEDIVAVLQRAARPGPDAGLRPVSAARRSADARATFNEAAGTVAYRWKADERGFAMPIRVGEPRQVDAIQPTTDWKLMKTPLKKDAFEVATDLYYVNVTKQ